MQHLILKSEYDYDYDEFDNPHNEDNWLFQTREKFMKYVIYHSSDITLNRTTANQKLGSFKKA